jgi:hypothetical protein
LDNVGGSPDIIEFWTPKKENDHLFLPGEMDLYANGRPVWLEPQPFNGRVDIVAIPVVFPPETHVLAVQDFATEGGRLACGQDVVIIGFPFGRSDQTPLAIWKRAMVASEPQIALSGRPRYFLDTPGRPGMSGSPVYAMDRALAVSDRAHAIMTDPSDQSSYLERLARLDAPSDFPGYETFKMRLVGVYSGSLRATSRPGMSEMGLGFSWLGPLVSRMISDPVPGTNPFPPDSAAWPV